MHIDGCDYLILTASNDVQAYVYRKQLAIRRQLGLLEGIRNTLVVPDIDGKRIGSGGSTLCCLMEVLHCELGDDALTNDVSVWKRILQSQKVLIIHAGGDSKRLPIYSACGKLFVPTPGQWDGPVPLTLFDQQLGTYLSLFNREHRSAQFIITSGDVLLRFKADPLEYTEGTVTGFCCPASPEQASRHGVFCLDSDRHVRLYLQKPSYQQQQEYQALNNYQQAMLDIGIMAFDDTAAIEMLTIFDLKYDSQGKLLFKGPLAEAIIRHGLDFYRELCCAFGSQANKSLHCQSAVSSGSTWSAALLGDLFDKAQRIGFRAKPLSHCDFLDFGSVKRLIDSGYRLARDNNHGSKGIDCISLDNCISERGSAAGSSAWVEGCSLQAHLELKGNNIVTGINLRESLSLEMGQCLDIVPGKDETGTRGWFVRCYMIDDDFKSSENTSPRYCGVSLDKWLNTVDVQQSDIRNGDVVEECGDLFTAKLFPFIEDEAQFRDFLWMFTPEQASTAQVAQWKSAKRYSHQEIGVLTDYEAFLMKRQSNRINGLTDKISQLFRPSGALSDLELCYILKHTDKKSTFIQNTITAAYACSASDSINQSDVLISSRILHTLGSALERVDWPADQAAQILSEFQTGLAADCIDWLESVGVTLADSLSLKEWAEVIQNAAFQLHSGAIIKTGQSRNLQSRSCLRSDEIVWARAPARLDIAGGWTDTPPYALEWGGAVLNAAVNLNGQPPIQAYLRVINEPIIKIGSIDLGLQVIIHHFDELNNYRDVTSGFSLAKAALIQEIFSHFHSDKSEASLSSMLQAFGGGIELTTLAAIPKGSGLGTSSIMGAVIVAAINCAMGRQLSNRELSNAVLRLEQTLTTGGGWQDQIGGVLEGVKLILTEPGLVPNPTMQYLRKDVIEPSLNGGQTLLYYTGITRLAKNILRQVVGRYLNRDRHAMRILKQIRQAALDGAEIIGSKDYAQFGALLGRSWELNKQLDPDSTNAQVETMFERISPYIYGAKLLGAGGGGFILMACKSQDDARRVYEDLTENPCDVKARFFNYDVSGEGLVVTVC